jgi:sec-independent protein translocase protein TatA
MGSMSIWHWVIVALIVMLLFGKGRISEMMGDLAKGIKSFKKGLADEEAAATAPPAAQVTQQPPLAQGVQSSVTPDQAPR